MDISSPSLSDRGAPLSTSAFHVLLALADAERHGYAIMQEVDRLTQGGVRLAPGTLYRCIKQLLQSALIEESDQRPDPSLDDERRRYYRITAIGRRAATAEAMRLEALVEASRRKQLMPARIHTTGVGR